MIIHVKVGTHAAYYAKVVRKRNPPKVGDYLELWNPDGYFGCGKTLHVYCDRIDGDLYFMELM